MYKKFSLKLMALFLATLVLLEISTEYFASKNRFVKHFLKSKRGNTECIIAGDSHPSAAFQDIIKECANISLGGTSIPMLIDLTEPLINSKKLKRVIFSLDPHNFTAYRVRGTSDDFKLIHESIFLSQNGFIRKIAKNNFKELKRKYLNKLKKETKEQINKKPSKKAWYQMSASSRTKLIDRRLKRHIPKRNIKNHEFYLVYLDYTKRLISNNIEVCLVRTPNDYEYEEKLFESLKKDEWNSIVKSFTDAGAVYVDHKDIIEKVSLEHLSNQDHLNRKGAVIFAPKAYEACFNSQTNEL